MKSNYKRLGDYIQEIDVRNRDDELLELWGVSIEKKFIKSVANIIGTDLAKYKIVKRNQFVCSLMQVSRDEKIPIALWSKTHKIIVSPAYKVFEIIRQNDLLSEYLNLWFRRAEFDREASYYGVGGVRGSLEWNDFCDLQLPVPSFDEQQKIVDSYNVIENRIALKRKINDNLDAQAATLYWQWIDDCSSQGFASKVPLGTLIKLFDSRRVPLSSGKRAIMERLYPYYGAASLMDYVDNYIYDGIFLLLGEDGSVTDERGYPILQYVNGKFWVNNHAHVIQGANGYSTEMLLLLLKRTNILEYVTGAVQAKLNQENLNAIPIVAPNVELRNDFNKKIQQYFTNIRHIEREIILLEFTKKQILSGIASHA